MTDQEKIQSFGDLVDATEKMSLPWRETVHKLIKALIITNLFWALIVGLLVWFAYMTPIDVEQGQDFDSHMQTQSYSQGAADGS